MSQAPTRPPSAVLIATCLGFFTSPLGAAPPVAPIPNPAALYKRSLKADDLYSYRGRQVTTYWHAGRAVAVIVSHRAPRLRRIDYLAPDAQRGRCVVTDSTQEWQYDPRHAQLLHRRLDPSAEAVADAAERYDLLRANYVLQVLPQSRTWADRKVYVVTITRRADRTAARKLWIDATTGLVLKRENYREDGKLALTVAYSDVTFHAPLQRVLFDLSVLARRPGVRVVEERPRGETPVSLGTVARQLSGAARAPARLAGFRLVSAALTREGRTLHLRYSDGLNLVSLYEQRRTHQNRPTHVRGLGAVRPARIGRRDGYITHYASQTILNWDAGLLNLSLVGEIAEAALQGLAVQADR